MKLKRMLGTCTCDSLWVEDALHLAVAPQLKRSSPWWDHSRYDESLNWR